MSRTDWFVVVFLVVAIAERLHERRFSQRAVRGERRMEWSYAALHSFHALIFAATAVEYFLRRRDLTWAVTGVGLALFVVAMIVRVTAIRALGRFWSLHLEIRQEHKLITEGVYRYLRHPAYSAIMLEVISVPLVANAYVALALAVCAYVPLLLLRWRREEIEMIDKFGDEYVRYRRQVPAFIPYRRPRSGERSDATIVSQEK